MNCLSENQLQALIDSELDEKSALSVKKHLESCQACNALFEKMEDVNGFTSGKIDTYIADVDAKSTLSSHTPLNTIKPVRGGEKNFMKSYKRYIATAAAVCLLVVGFTVEPVRAAVSDAVSIFRANDIKTMDISLEDLSALEKALSQNEGNIDIENLAKVETTGGTSKTVSLSDAEKGITFKLKSLKGLEGQSPKDIYLTEASNMTFQLNVDKVNSLMKTLGATKFFSKDLDNKPFSIYTAGTVSMQYEIAKGEKTQYISYVQTRFPEITAPTGTSVSELTEAIASLGILPSNLQSQIRSMADANEILYIPNINGMLEKMEIGGVNYFVQFDKEEGYYSNAIWTEDGALNMLSGNFDKEDFKKLILGE